MDTSRLLVILSTALALQLGFAGVARADSEVLHYTGNNFTTVSNSFSSEHFDSTMYLSATIYLPNELGANFDGGIDVRHTEFTLTSGNLVYVHNSASGLGYPLGGMMEMYFRTDGSGSIMAWDIRYSGPFGCGSDCGVRTCYDLARDCSAGADSVVAIFQQNGINSASAANNPGRWATQVPEPNSAVLLVMGLSGIVIRYRKKLLLRPTL